MSLVKDIIRGAGYIPHLGYHPGTPLMVLFILIGTFGGGLMGAAMMATWSVPLWLIGCVERARYK